MLSSIPEQYHELSFYSLGRGDVYFIHQHIVDAQTAQTATAETKPISILFALAGLFLFVEKNYTGRQVQQMHQLMAKNKNTLPTIILPENRGDIIVSDVLATSPGEERDEMIKRWCVSVWEAYQNNIELIIDLIPTIL